MLFGSPASAKGPYGSISVGLWKGGAYTSDQTGDFSHCAAGASYLSGIYVVFSQSKDSTWMLGFARDTFHLNIGETFEIDVTFDGQTQFHLFGTAISTNQIAARLPNNALLNQFRKSKLMVAQAKGATFQFDLHGTGQLIPTIANCVNKMKSGNIASAGDFALPPPPPPVAKNVVQSTPSTPEKSSATPKTFAQNGAGFVVSKAGHVVTNNHVIEGCVGPISGNFTGEAAGELRIVSTDETNDLALLQTTRPTGEMATIRNTPVHSGDSVIAIGFPFHGLLTSDFTVTTGIVSSLSGLLNDTRFLQISASVQPGNSGGPLLDSSGYLTGVVAAKINALKFAKATGDLPENINFAIKTGALRDFLDNSAVSYKTGESQAEIKTADIAR
jgi:S1-C subfamily serine protease